MPLSENEQRILRQIEQQLERDPTFSTRGYRIPRRRVAALGVAVFIGVALTVLALATGVWLSVLAFLGTVVLAVLLERELRVIIREKVGSVPLSAWLGGGRNRPGRANRTSPSDSNNEYDR